MGHQDPLNAPRKHYPHNLYDNSKNEILGKKDILPPNKKLHLGLDYDFTSLPNERTNCEYQNLASQYSREKFKWKTVGDMANKSVKTQNKVGNLKKNIMKSFHPNSRFQFGDELSKQKVMCSHWGDSFEILTGSNFEEIKQTGLCPNAPLQKNENLENEKMKKFKKQPILKDRLSKRLDKLYGQFILPEKNAKHY